MPLKKSSIALLICSRVPDLLVNVVYPLRSTIHRQNTIVARVPKF